MRKSKSTCLYVLVIMCICVSSLYSAENRPIQWIGDDWGYWNIGANWDPNEVPDDDLLYNYLMTIDTDILPLINNTCIRIEQNRTISQLDCDGSVRLELWPGNLRIEGDVTNDGWLEFTGETHQWDNPTLTVTGTLINNGEIKMSTRPHSNEIFIVDANYLNTSGAELSLVAMDMDGRITNESGAFLYLEGCIKIEGDVINQTGGFMEVDDESYSVLDASFEMGTNEINGILQNNGNCLIIPGGQLVMDDDGPSLFVNSGKTQVYGGEIETQQAINDPNGIICGYGVVFTGQRFDNQGTIEGFGGSLNLPYLGAIENTGTIRSRASGAVMLLPLEIYGDPNEFYNHGLIEICSGSSVEVDTNLYNCSDGSIELLGGTVSTQHLYQKAGASFEGLGNITGDVTIESGGVMTFTGTSNIFGDVVIEAGATLVVEDGTIYVYGNLTNNGTIQRIGGRVICNGDYIKGSQLEQPSVNNSVSDYNLDGQVDISDFAAFAQNWLWYSQI